MRGDIWRLFSLEKGSDAYVYRRRDLTPLAMRGDIWRLFSLEKGTDASLYRRDLAPTPIEKKKAHNGLREKSRGINREKRRGKDRAERRRKKFSDRPRTKPLCTAKSWQHPKDFPSGPPPQYYPGPATVNFGVLKRSGVFVAVWPPADIVPRFARSCLGTAELTKNIVFYPDPRLGASGF